MSPQRPDFEQLLARLAPRLCALARQYCGREREFEMADFVQELRIRVWQALERDHVVEHWPAYLRRAALSVVIDAQRRRMRLREVPLEHVAEDPDATTAREATPERRAQDAQSLQRVRSALQALPERRRQAAALLLQGFTTEEIGRMLQISEATARNLAYRGVDELREALLEPADDDGRH